MRAPRRPWHGRLRPGEAAFTPCTALPLVPKPGGGGGWGSRRRRTTTTATTTTTMMATTEIAILLVIETALDIIVVIIITSNIIIFNNININIIIEQLGSGYKFEDVCLGSLGQCPTLFLLALGLSSQAARVSEGNRKD